MDHNQIAKQSYSLPCEILTCKKQKNIARSIISCVPRYHYDYSFRIMMIYLVWPYLDVDMKSLWSTNKEGPRDECSYDIFLREI
jgi:hypothetical protein